MAKHSPLLLVVVIQIIIAQYLYVIIYICQKFCLWELNIKLDLFLFALVIVTFQKQKKGKYFFFPIEKHLYVVMIVAY